MSRKKPKTQTPKVNPGFSEVRACAVTDTDSCWDQKRMVAHRLAGILVGLKAVGASPGIGRMSQDMLTVSGRVDWSRCGIGPKPDKLAAKCGELASHRFRHGELEAADDGREGPKDKAQRTIDWQAYRIIEDRWEEIEDLAAKLVEDGEAR